MADVENLHGRLAGELAAVIARRLTMNCNTHIPGKKGAYFYLDPETTIKDATRVLTDLDLLSPIRRDDKPDETWYCNHALTMDSESMPAYLGQRITYDDPRLPKLLEVFVDLLCGYDDLPDIRSSFLCPPKYLNSARLLVHTGYMAEAGGQYRWTDKIGPAMQACYSWTADNEYVGDVEEREREAEAEAILQAIPGHVRDKFVNNGSDLMEWMKAIALCWNDGAWQAPAKDGGRVTFTGGNQLALLVAKKFKEKFGLLCE